MTVRARSQAVGGVLGLACALALAACAPVAPKDRVLLISADFSDLPGWRADDPAPALDALKRSCAVHLRRPETASVGRKDLAGTEADWRAPCRALAALDLRHLKAKAARAFIERHFRPFAVVGPDGRDGLFTGYYEPQLHGSRMKTARYDIPLYARPHDLVSADLGRFSDEFRGRTIAGKVVGTHFVPYDDRAAITNGALKGRDLEILWVDDPVDAFFLQIQGSGQVLMRDGTIIRLGYAGKNGRPYTSIGRYLVKIGALSKDNVSMQSIRAWLESHPVRAHKVMARNRSYVFFRKLPGDGPLGAEGVALTPGRSLAVDRKFLPLGVPLFVSAGDETGALAPVHHLFVAQDTGGAIRGAVRGDLFQGAGPAAAARAGRMKMTGRYWLLLPRAAAARRIGA